MSYAGKVHRLFGGDEQVIASGGKQTVESGGEVDFESGAALNIAGVQVTSTAAELNSVDGAVANLKGVDPVVYCHAANVTLAEVNAGKVLVAALTGRTLTVVDWSMKALGGAAAAATSVDLQDTAGSPVAIAAVAVAALTEDVVVKPSSANVTDGAGGVGVALTAAKGIRIIKNGSDATTATSFQVTVHYSIADA